MTKKTLIIGGIGNYNWEQIKYWVNSSSLCKNSRRILLSYNSNADLINRLIDNGIEVYDMTHDSFGNVVNQFVCNSGFANKDTTPYLVHHIRFWHMYQLLKEIGTDDIGWCIHNDIRDLVYQTDVDDWLTNFSYSTEYGRGKNAGKTIIAPSEYVTFGEESWNSELAKTNYGEYVFQYALKNSLVYNVGSFAADVNDFLNICLFTYQLCHRRNKLADQPSMALLFSTIMKDKVYTAKTKDAWALQCAILLEQYEKYKTVIRGQLPIIRDDGFIVNEKNEPYCIVHQYDRVPAFKTLLEEKFK